MSELYWINPFYGSSDPEPILRDVFDGWESGHGIFDVLAIIGNLPWEGVTSVDNNVLDISYFGNHSGGKFCSPLVKLVLDDEGKVPTQARITIAKIILSKYLPNWERLWETNIVSYSPINNYDMMETRNLRTAKSEAEEESLDRTGTETTSHEITQNTTDYRYGINTDTDDPKPSDKSDVSDTGETTVERDLNDAKERNTVGAGEEEEETHRVGNIGVTTNQKLIQEERALWIWNYFDSIFKDLDNELALAFHDPCRV